MFNKNILILGSVCLSLAACSSNAGSLSGPKYVPRLTIPESEYTELERTQDAMDKKYYEQYEQRETCQRYRAEPRNMMLVNCRLVPVPPPAAPAVEVYDFEVPPPAPMPQPRLLPIINSYTVYFDFDKSNVRASELPTIDRVANEIHRFNPEQITVTGHTDTSGSPEYNQKLSQRRADSVVRALSGRGINSQVVDEKARGEYDLAVPTGDDVKLEENRRVVIDFRR